MDPTPFIEFKDITKIFGKKVVLDGVNLEIPEGEIFGIIGKSGSGKSTLLNLLVGFLRPEKGIVSYKGRDVKKNIANVDEEFGFTAQEGSFYPKLTVKENLEYFGSMYGMPKHEIDEKIPVLLEQFDLSDTLNVLGGNLSKGMQKRLDIACGLVHDPKVLILDEPTEDLDPLLRKEILKLLHKINKNNNVTILITSHLLDEMEILCTKIAILHDKEILESGTVNELKYKYSRNMEIKLETYSGNYGWIIKELKKKDLKAVQKGHKVIIFTPRAEETLDFVMGLLKEKKEKLMDVDVDKPTLNEVFEDITKKQNETIRDIKKKL
ncbi:ABC transporter ATP-binding protein [archaeon]|nr:ABC transporter ATP-binding protein [archaeon]